MFRAASDFALLSGQHTHGRRTAPANTLNRRRYLTAADRPRDPATHPSPHVEGSGESVEQALEVVVGGVEVR
jgi:ketosteroid isomerase-like protein